MIVCALLASLGGGGGAFNTCRTDSNCRLLGKCRSGKCECEEGEYTIGGCMMQAAMAAERTRMKHILESPHLLATTMDPIISEAFHCTTSADCNELGTCNARRCMCDAGYYFKLCVHLLLHAKHILKERKHFSSASQRVLTPFPTAQPTKSPSFAVLPAATNDSFSCDSDMDCNLLGSCTQSKCVCHSGYYGDDCSAMTPPTSQPTQHPTPAPKKCKTKGDCSWLGNCHHERCHCNAGFFGDSCDVTIAPTQAPTQVPTTAPTSFPTPPTKFPTRHPTLRPSTAPTHTHWNIIKAMHAVTPAPTPALVYTTYLTNNKFWRSEPKPESIAPSFSPTLTPSFTPSPAPTPVTPAPTQHPTLSNAAKIGKMENLAEQPAWRLGSLLPSISPTHNPTWMPTTATTNVMQRTARPTARSSPAPTFAPTAVPTLTRWAAILAQDGQMVISNAPTLNPTLAPTAAPTPSSGFLYPVLVALCVRKRGLSYRVERNKFLFRMQDTDSDYLHWSKSRLIHDSADVLASSHEEESDHTFDSVPHLKFGWEASRSEVAKENLELHIIAEAMQTASLAGTPSLAPTHKPTLSKHDDDADDDDKAKKRELEPPKAQKIGTIADSKYSKHAEQFLAQHPGKVYEDILHAESNLRGRGG